MTASGWVRRGDRDEVRERIADGHGSMPGFAKKLSADELEGLVEYVVGGELLPARSAPDP